MKLSITIDVKELIYDIQNKTYLTGRSRSDGNNHRQVALMQANDDDENLNQIMRSISSAFAKVEAELSEVLEEKSATGSNTLSLTDDAEVISLTMPSNFNAAATNAIASAIHQFIVASVTSEWFMITNKADTEDYAQLSEKSLQLLRESLCRRQRPSRKTELPTSLTTESATD